MKLLLTGSTGFFGRNFLERYGEDHLITAPTHKKLNLTDVGAINNFFAKDYYDVVLHLAGNDKKPSKKITESDNFIMFKNLQRAVITNRIPRLIVIGSGSEYDSNRNVSGVIEEEIGFNVPIDPRGVSRYLINMLAAKDKVTTNLRHFSVYGKYSSPYINLISKLAYFVAAGQDIILEKDKVVSLVYVDDSLKVMNAAINGELPKNDYNVVSKTPFKLSQIARYLKEISGKNINIIVKSKEKDIEYSGNNARLTAAMPKLKFTPVKKGLTVLYEWMERAKDTFKPELIKIK